MVTSTELNTEGDADAHICCARAADALDRGSLGGSLMLLGISHEGCRMPDSIRAQCTQPRCCTLRLRLTLCARCHRHAQAGVALGLAKTLSIRFPTWGPDFSSLMVRIHFRLCMGACARPSSAAQAQTVQKIKCDP